MEEWLYVATDHMYLVKIYAQSTRYYAIIKYPVNYMYHYQRKHGLFPKETLHHATSLGG